MKIKKFNMVAAMVLLGGALLLPGAVSRWVVRPLSSFGVATASIVAPLAKTHAVADEFSSEGKQATVIAWRSRHGEMPGETTLKKWVVGDRTYYEATGPINPRFRDVRARPDSWEDYFAFEVFFARGGNAYDQWIINPNNSFVFHFEDRCRRTGRSDLPSSRYRVKIEGDRVSIIFWCHNSDTPRNIVFNYNEPTPSTPEKLSWVTTDLGQDHDPWWHHQPAEWTDP